MPHKRKRHLDEIVPSPGLFQQGTKQHKEKHHGSGDAEGNAKHPLGLHPEMPHGLAKRGALPLHHLRDEILIAKEHVYQEHTRHDTQRQAE